ncbi:MAG TPA: chromosomal replication initiator protein DnaA [Thermoanaerobaculales bacterium]|nr:chromosomal replication initiator protein DnaA [Thermoanaerobaculales bacterium]HQL31234.1 chromosomal replication initiator protein DnaA [Thermoanaerobaculales bacterium]HQN95810.1 chromosomal replication initiator protein DnaA [Thermoanaerobaculales bacterium]
MERWKELQPHLQKMLGEDEYATWIGPLRVVASNERSLTLSSDNSIVTDWVRDHLLSDIETVARGHFGPAYRIEIAATAGGGAKRSSAAAAAPFATHPIHPAFTFDRFVVGPSNQFATAAAEAVADRPGEAYNPLYIYGGSGLGKTHLLHAIAHRVDERYKRRKTKLKVVYMTTEQFVNELINCIRRKQMELFRQTFRGVDILLLDDIQFIAGKEQTQQEFFHTFNTLQSTGRQVVFTSDARPADIPGLEERLRSRFLQGLIADIQPPDLETRCAILREKARAIGWELPEDVVLFIARRVQKNVRELEGYLNRTIAYAQLKNTRITVDVVRMALFELMPDQRQTSPGDIIRFVAQHYGIRVADLKGRSNRRSIALPRQVAMYLIRDILELSFPEIGKIFAKHHSTAMYAVDIIQKMRQSNPDFDATLTAFRDHFG